ncbi:MAG: metallophosphoesterase [Candidatus Marsarchaeota archaeon]|nr:metallophosphoesterase [Candidatus Marsarchaeota archaeon]
MVVIGAVGDIHAPVNTREFISSLPYVNIDLFLFAGDSVEPGCTDAFEPVLKSVRERYGARVYACFGNNEYGGDRTLLRKKFPEVRWLDDESSVAEVDGRRVYIYGSQGVLHRPTGWQLRNLGNIESVYKARKKAICTYFEEVAQEPGLKLLLTHYATTRHTLYGEGESYMDQLGCDFFDLFSSGCVHLSLHGHAHLSKRTYASVGKANVYNVAFPATRKVTVIEL